MKHFLLGEVSFLTNIIPRIAHLPRFGRRTDTVETCNTGDTNSRKRRRWCRGVHHQPSLCDTTIAVAPQYWKGEIKEPPERSEPYAAFIIFTLLSVHSWNEKIGNRLCSIVYRIL